MKKLLLVRHAKSSWGDHHLEDMERPLNERGKKDAPIMASRLLERHFTIDAFISSPAKRARKTAELFAKKYQRAKEEIIIEPSLYLASAQTMIEIIKNLPNSLSTVALFSHNPGITQMVNMLTTVKVDNMPTCAIFAVSLESNEWKNFMDSPLTFLFFDYPKLVT